MILLAALLASAAIAAPREIPFEARRAEVPVSEGTLTNEVLLRVDPGSRNPHRARWALERRVEPVGLEAYKRKDGYLALKIEGLRAETRLWFRANGPWYRAPDEFPCGRAAGPDWYATLEGSRVAATRAAELWESTLRARRQELALTIAKIALPPATSLEAANKAASIVFANWLREGEREWRDSAPARARDAELKSYRDEAAKASRCATKGKGKAVASKPDETPLWESLMEPPGHAEPARKPLVRAPARRWAGLFSVRLGLTIAGKKLVGQFLIDSGSDRSTLSPEFLKAMGMPIELVRVPGARPERLHPSSQLASSGARGAGLARLGVVDAVEMSGFALPVREFLLTGSDLFGAPESAATCCDGVLGLDFLSRFVVELSETLPYEVRLYSPVDYHGGAHRFWVEAVQKPGEGVTSSSCLADPNGTLARDGKRASRVVDPKKAVAPVRWDSGGQFAAASRARSSSTASWTVECLERDVAHDFTLDEGESRESPWASGFTLGMTLLSQVRPIYDLPNGRIWLAKRSVPATILRNRSGLELEFGFGAEGERILRVVSLKPRSPAQQLVKEGVRPGLRIEAVDGVPAGELSDWDIEQRLAGALGDAVTLKWTVKHEPKVATLKLPPRAVGGER